MKLDRHLNLVVPIDRDAGPLYVHATPIAREVFERYFLPISRTYAAMFAQNLTAFGAPRVAALLLRKTAIEMGEWEGSEGVEQGLMAEIRRLANVAMPGANGWATVPYEEARARKLLDDDELSEIENILVFFILASAMSRRKNVETVLGLISTLWDAQIISSNSTEFAASLPTSKPAEPTGERAQASPIPY